MLAAMETRLWHPFANMAQVRETELVIERGEDVWVWDDQGNRYLDASASLWYANVGHGRPEIQDAVSAQLPKLDAYSTYGDMSNRPANELAARLARLAPRGRTGVLRPRRRGCDRHRREAGARLGMHQS